MHMSTLPDERTELHVAAANNDAAAAKRLIDAGAVIDAVETKFGQTPLHFAAASGCLDVAILLVDSGASIDLVDKAGFTPLWTAAMNRKRCPDGALVKLLVSHGADVDHAGKNGRTPRLLAEMIDGFPLEWIEGSHG